MTRTYPYSHAATALKEQQVWEVLKACRQSAQQIANDQWKALFITGSMKKDGPICPPDHIISKRYRQTCQRQVVGVLKSWLSNRKNDFDSGYPFIPLERPDGSWCASACPIALHQQIRTVVQRPRYHANRGHSAESDAFGSQSLSAVDEHTQQAVFSVCGDGAGCEGCQSRKTG